MNKENSMLFGIGLGRLEIGVRIETHSSVIERQKIEPGRKIRRGKQAKFLVPLTPVIY